MTAAAQNLAWEGSRDALPLDNAALDALAMSNDERTGERMMQAVHDLLSRFVVYPSDHARVAHALWIVHAHLMDRWDSTPRLAFLSAEPGSGKSRALEITELLVPRPVMAVNVSPAYLFRKVGDEAGAPTILFDEIDTVFGPKAKDNEEVRGLLNAGHRRGAVAGRCVVRGKVVETEEIPAYSAVALAGLGWLPDTIMTRSVIIRMRRRHAGEQVEAFRHRVHAPEGAAVYERIETWVHSLPAEIEWPELPDEIQDRAADVWEPLIAVADMAGGDWPARARKAAVALVAAASDAEPSLGVRLLADLRTIFGDDTAMSSAALLAALKGLDEAPWSDIRGKPLDQRGLSQRLKQYGIKSRTVRVGGATPKGYTRTDLEDAWARYLSPIPAKSATSATSATSLNYQPNFVADGMSDPPHAVSYPPHVADVADGVAGAADKNSCNINDVADVALVALLAGYGEPALGFSAAITTDSKYVTTADFEERAAVLEYEAGLSRTEAEAQARAELGLDRVEQRDAPT